MAANAADLSAKAAIAVELPRMHVVIESENLARVISTAILNPVTTPQESEGLLHIDITVIHHFKNYGKTPAIIREISWGKLVFSKEPPIPVYSYSMKSLPEYMIAAQGKTSTETSDLGTLLTLNQTRAILAGETSLWFYGKIIYWDVFGNEQWHRFYWRFSGMGPLQPYDHEHYNENAYFERRKT